MSKDKRTAESLSLEQIVRKVAPEQSNFIADRFASSAANIALDDLHNGDIGFMHSVLCQTSLPYRNPKDLTIWEEDLIKVSVRRFVLKK